MEHHPIFKKFPPYSGRRPAGMDVHYTGAMFPSAWHDRVGEPENLDYVAPIPKVNEEYFEWIDLLTSVWDARDRGSFTMAELGAGHGRWGISGAFAAAQFNMPSQLVFVEAEPQHTNWLATALVMHGLSAEVHDRAIAYDCDVVPFYVSKEHLSAANWFGQYVCPLRDGVATDRIYHGRVVFRSLAYPDCEYVEVPTITFAAAIERLSCIDLVDMDLQGAERDVVAHDMATFNAKVRKVHIGTHSQEAEEFIRKQFSGAGWTNVWDFPGDDVRETPYGPVNFQDGVQTWINPHIR